MTQEQINIEQIPSDTVLKMTPEWHRAFNAAGCDPMCHCCESMIPVDMEFKLATVKQSSSWSAPEQKADLDALNGKGEGSRHLQSIEVMLCADCTAIKFLENQKNKLSTAINKKEQGGCFRIYGKIVH